MEKCNSLKMIEGNSASSVEWPDSSIISSLMDGNSFPFGAFSLASFPKVGLMGQRLCSTVCCDLPDYVALSARSLCSGSRHAG